jgi:prepilin-type N-terminal cleavage/methylation domain-containing protein
MNVLLHAVSCRRSEVPGSRRWLTAWHPVAEARHARVFAGGGNEGQGAFTLIEVMVVVAIMAVIMGMGMPMTVRALRKEPMRKAITDIVEVCSNARARAILQGKEVDLIFHPLHGSLEIGAAPVSTFSHTAESTRGPAAARTPTPPAAAVVAAPGSGLSAQLGEDVVIEMLDINHLGEFREAEEARVRFYPNGTCDEMTLIIRIGQDQKGIVLEITTGLTTVLDQDALWKLRSGVL